MEFQGRYRKDKKDHTLRCLDESRTKQSFREQTNINNIIKKYRKTGLITHVNKYQGIYGDFSQVSDFRSALHRMAAAQEAFESLPADLRFKFGNDPARFVDFCDDPNNADTMREMGLLPQLPITPVDASNELKTPSGGSDTPEAKKTP